MPGVAHKISKNPNFFYLLSPRVSLKTVSQFGPVGWLKIQFWVLDIFKAIF